MRRNYYLFELNTMISGFVNAQNVNIPDAAFKAYLIGNTDINTNGDGEIQVSEAQAFTGMMNCSYRSITDLTGIEAFVNLTILACGGNQLTSLDVSNITALINLQCWGNALTSLDVSNNLALTYLDCSSNQLTSLNVQNGNNSNFTYFGAWGNPNLLCIQVDDVSWSATNWGYDINAHTNFSEDCANATCFINSPAFAAEYTNTTATITWTGTGTYEVEYGLYPYVQGTGGETLPQIVSTTEDNTLTITELTPGKAYTVHIRKICDSDESQWKQVIIGTSIATPVTEFPYLEDFEHTNSRYFFFNYGWTNVISSVNHSYWGLFSDGTQNLYLSVRDWAAGANNKTIYSRGLQLVEGYTYTISLDYNWLWLGSFLIDSQNHPNLNVLINSSASETGSTIISALTDISNPDFQTYIFQYTPSTSGVYYFGINADFAQNPIQDPEWANGVGFNWLSIDNFKVEEETLSIEDSELSSIMIYPNPVQNVLHFSKAVNNITIYDLTGRTIKSFTGNQDKIDVSGLSNGNYILKGETESGEWFNVKFVKN